MHTPATSPLPRQGDGFARNRTDLDSPATFSPPQASTDRRMVTAIGITGKETQKAPACRGLLRSVLAAMACGGRWLACGRCALAVGGFWGRSRGRPAVGRGASAATLARPGWRPRGVPCLVDPGEPGRASWAGAAWRQVRKRWRQLSAAGGPAATWRANAAGRSSGGSSASHRVRRDTRLSGSDHRSRRTRFDESPIPTPESRPLRAPSPAATQPPGHWAGRGCAPVR
ncbi:hypothetical protein GGR71_001706 [Xanthomonas sp. F1]